MNTVRRIAKNMGVLLFTHVESYILGFFIMYTARYLGAEVFGIKPFCFAKTFSPLPFIYVYYKDEIGYCALDI